MPHATATLNGKVIAETDHWEYVEGNIYVGQQYSTRAPMLMVLVPSRLCGPVSAQQRHSNYRLPMERQGFLLQHHRRWYVSTTI